MDTKEQGAFLETVASVLKQGGAPPDTWDPLVTAGLALLPVEKDIVWARLALLRDRFESMTNGTVRSNRWLGEDPEAVAFARASGDEGDYARTLRPLQWRGRQELGDIAARLRTWRSPSAIIPAMIVVTRALVEQHGDCSCQHPGPEHDEQFSQCPDHCLDHVAASSVPSARRGWHRWGRGRWRLARIHKPHSLHQQ